jgi:ATP-dependent Clp protease protease subunit
MSDAHNAFYNSEHVNWVSLRQVCLLGEIGDPTANDLIARLLFLQSQDANLPVNLTINCPGGSIVASLAIYDTIKSLSCDVETHCAGLAAGSALLLLAAGKKGKRTATRDACFMMIKPTIGDPVGRSTEIELSESDQMSRLRELLDRMFAAETRLTADQIHDLTDGGNCWMESDRARAIGFIDTIRDS